MSDLWAWNRLATHAVSSSASHAPCMASAGASAGTSAGTSAGASAGAGAGAGTGAGPAALWGECRGSAAAPYLTVIDLSGPAYRCSCPSRKFPCKHALALLLRWAEGTVPEAPGEPPGWAAGWLAARARAWTLRKAERAEGRDLHSLRSRKLNQRDSQLCTRRKRSRHDLQRSGAGGTSRSA